MDDLFEDMEPPEYTLYPSETFGELSLESGPVGIACTNDRRMSF
jgi:hypothetical protein